MKLTTITTAGTPVDAAYGSIFQVQSVPTDWIVMTLVLCFGLGVAQSLRTYVRASRTIRDQIDQPKPELERVAAAAERAGCALPFFVILVPAYDERAVIQNTIARLTDLNYAPERYAVIIVTDAREKKLGSARTTREIAIDLAERINAHTAEPVLYVFEVPEWYSGRFGSEDRTFAKSTKGRALNFGLDQIRADVRLSKADMLGILDADGRLHRALLCEAAYKRLTDGTQLLQGPVFQISNFPDVGLVGKMAGVELSLYHLSTLARQLQSRRNVVRFLAGTNYFVDLKLIVEAGGWNEAALAEDAELGLRLFLRSGVRPQWLSCHEIEQTPPDRKTYLSQRERWALGHFQLLPAIRRSPLPWRAKLSLQGRVVGAVFKTLLDSGLPLLGWTALALGWTRDMPPPLPWIMLGLLIASLFVWDFFGRGAAMLNRYAPRPLTAWSLSALRLLFIVATPWLIVVQAQPRLTGFLRYVFGRYPLDWNKTARSIEASTGPPGLAAVDPCVASADSAIPSQRELSLAALSEVHEGSTTDQR